MSEKIKIPNVYCLIVTSYDKIMKFKKAEKEISVDLLDEVLYENGNLRFATKENDKPIYHDILNPEKTYKDFRVDHGTEVVYLAKPLEKVIDMLDYDCKNYDIKLRKIVEKKDYIKKKQLAKNLGNLEVDLFLHFCQDKDE